jgi:hypothetical protein
MYKQLISERKATQKDGNVVCWVEGIRGDFEPAAGKKRVMSRMLSKAQKKVQLRWCCRDREEHS